MADHQTTTTIWIVRWGSGKAQVHPSPVHLRPGETFEMKNWAGADAEVVFPTSDITPAKTIMPAGGRPVTFHVADNAARQLHDYDVEFPGLRQYAEGNSKPGVIVDG